MIEYGVKLSKNQMLKLRRGHRISLKHSALTGPHKLMLTEAQVKKLEKAKKAGRGSTLQLEGSQVNQNILGGSVLSTLKSMPRKFSKMPMEGEGIGSFFKSVGRVAKKVGNVAEKVYKNPIGKKLIDTGVDVGLKKLVTKGAGRKRKMKTAVMPDPMIEGEGFGDFIKGVARVGKKVYDNPIGKKLVNTLGEKGAEIALKKITGKGRKRKVEIISPDMEGGNIFTDIYRKVLKPTYSKVLKPAYNVGKKVYSNPIAKKVIDVAGKKGLEAAMQKVSGKGRGRPRKTGMGIFAPGQR